jgi:hypothetical protein
MSASATCFLLPLRQIVLEAAVFAILDGRKIGDAFAL